MCVVCVELELSRIWLFLSLKTKLRIDSEILKIDSESLERIAMYQRLVFSPTPNVK